MEITGLAWFQSCRSPHRHDADQLSPVSGVGPAVVPGAGVLLLSFFCSFSSFFFFFFVLQLAAFLELEIGLCQVLTSRSWSMDDRRRGVRTSPANMGRSRGLWFPFRQKPRTRL